MTKKFVTLGVVAVSASLLVVGCGSSQSAAPAALTPGIPDELKAVEATANTKTRVIVDGQLMQMDGPVVCGTPEGVFVIRGGDIKTYQNPSFTIYPGGDGTRPGVTITHGVDAEDPVAAVDAQYFVRTPGPGDNAMGYMTLRQNGKSYHVEGKVQHGIQSADDVVPFTIDVTCP